MLKKFFLFIISGVLLAMMPAAVEAQNFDNSGTSTLTGAYLFRYVNFFNDASGNVTESCSITGVINFDGSGHYTTANAQLYDSAGATTGSCTSLAGGTYGVQPNGLMQLDNPLYAATLFGSFSQPVVIASSTEDFYFDLFIAVQAPSSAATNASFSGNYTLGTMDFLNASLTQAREGYFTISPNGNGSIPAFTVSGTLANSTASTMTQNVGATTYSISGTTGGTITFPGSSTDQNLILGGQQALYVSADGNYVIGGSTTGSDMIFGFKSASGVSNATVAGTYFIAGIDENNNFLDGFYGSINTNGNGNLIWHQRFDDVVDQVTYDATFDTPVTISSTGTYNDGTYTYLVGAGGKGLLLIGSGSQFSFNVGVMSPTVTPTSTVWLNPVGITNAGNYTPITNAYSPGELVILYGNFGVNLDVNKKLPIPTNLDGVQVLVNGTAAPVFYVSQNSISAVVPYEVSGDYFATFQVDVNGTKSNTVTVYVDNTSPGIYTLNENGLGDAALLHADYTPINESSPAQPGESVLLFMNGLGTVTPAVADGDPGSGTDLNYSDEYPSTTVYLDDTVNPVASSTLLYSGLAPGFAGLYQVNFTLPTTGLANGDVYIAFETTEASNEMATIPVSGFPTSTPAAKRSPRADVIAHVRAKAKLQAHARPQAQNHRRALPARTEVR